MDTTKLIQFGSGQIFTMARCDAKGGGDFFLDLGIGPDDGSARGQFSGRLSLGVKPVQLVIQMFIHKSMKHMIYIHCITFHISYV